MRAPWLIGVVLLATMALGCEDGRTVVRAPLVLPSAVALPDAHAGSTVVAFAAAQVGRPYCWGGTGPRCFDCSGLAQTAWRRAGVVLPRSADDIPRALPEVALTSVQPGDILWWPGHVGIYAGDGWSIEALNARSGVVRRKAPVPRRAFRPRAG